MTDRPKLGFGAEFDALSADDWTPKLKSKSPGEKTKEQIKSIAKASGFKSREVKEANLKPKQQRRRRTGRNTQFNIKADPNVIDRFIAVADANGWVFGEAFERAVELLEREKLT